MGSESSSLDSRLLLIRIRPNGTSPGPNLLPLEAEAILDYQSIYPASPFTIDLNALQAEVATPNNQYGTVLGASLCSARSIQKALAYVGQPDSLRIQLMLEGAGPHESIRWERVEFPARPGDPIALRRDTPFSRFAAVDIPAEAAPEDQRFHLVVAVASPASEGLAPIDVTGECKVILDACSDLLQNGQMDLTLMPGRAGLDSSLTLPSRVKVVDKPTTAEWIGKNLDRAHGLHVIAHGTKGKQFYLILEDEAAGDRACPDDELLGIWQPNRLRLVFLQSCQSALSSGSRDPRPFIQGFMTQLVRSGVPAVVAMQDFIRMDDAREFNRGFYTSLIREGLVDEAANNGRRSLRQSVDAAWSIPAVTTRLKGGAIWRESPLRAAQKKLRDRMKEENDSRLYPLFPIDVSIASAEDLRKRSTDPTRDDIQTVYPEGEGVQVDAFRALSDAVANGVVGETVCLVGAHGRAKSTLLEALYLSEIDRHWTGDQPLVPVMLLLEDCAESGFNAERTFASAISKYFKDRAGANVDPYYILECFDRQGFLFLLSGDEELSDDALRRAVRTLTEFQLNRRDPSSVRHRYVTTLDESTIKISDLPENARCLLIQPMSIERVTTYLLSFPTENPEHDPSIALYHRLCKGGLWDLAEVPWLLSEMLTQTSRGVLGETRAKILQRVVEDRVAVIAESSGARARVQDVLYRMAWEMYWTRKTNLPGTDLFDLLMKLRGNRDYSLVEFRSQLIHPGHVMAGSEGDGLRFSYPGFRSYCCAQYLFRQSPAERDRLLEEITATLGRRSRSQLWEEVLLILAGLWRDTGALLRMILSGVALGEGDQIYIAARCLQEARQAFPNGHTHDPIERSVVGVLIYRSHPRSLRSVSARKKSIRFLGPLQDPRAIPHLVSLAIKKVRPATIASGDEQLTFDYSGVRLAAIKALLYTPELVIEHVTAEPLWRNNLALHDALDAWLKFDGQRLCRTLKESTDTTVVSVAAFALSLTKIEGAHTALTELFLSPALSKDMDLLWAVTDALLELGDPALTQFVHDQLKNEARRQQIAYFIGKLGAARADSEEWKFLTENLDARDFRLRGRCLQALAELRDTSILDRCHRWLKEDRKVTREEGSVPRYYALQSLRHIGNEETLAILTQTPWRAEEDTATTGSLSLERLRLEVYEDIYWRLAGGRSRELMDPILQSSGLP